MNPYKRKGANPRYAVTSSRIKCIQQRTGSTSDFLRVAQGNMSSINVSIVEDATLAWFGIGCAIMGHAPRFSAGSSPNLDLSTLNLPISTSDLREVVA